ncbi:hypothetical protein CsSME_00041947 [Camellia sinensis var. sinensis]
MTVGGGDWDYVVLLVFQGPGGQRSDSRAKERSSHSGHSAFGRSLSVRNCFIRGSVVRYVQLPPDGVDIELLHDATRREARGG